MTRTSDVPEKEHHSHARPKNSARWRMATVATVAAASALAVISAVQADGLDLRVSSVTDLHSLVQHRRDQVDEKQRRVAALNEEVSRLGALTDDSRTRTIQRQVRRLRGPAGFTAVSGQGLSIQLNDTPKSDTAALLEKGVDGDNLVVHQQDIQAVVNALWAGGATAVTTTGIKCVGNTVVIRDIPYAPPYRIKAIGDPLLLQQRLYSTPWVAAYMQAVDDYNLGWQLEVVDDLDFEAYSGTVDLRYARPADQSR